MSSTGDGVYLRFCEGMITAFCFFVFAIERPRRDRVLFVSEHQFCDDNTTPSEAPHTTTEHSRRDARNSRESSLLRVTTPALHANVELFVWKRIGLRRRIVWWRNGKELAKIILSETACLR